MAPELKIFRGEPQRNLAVPPSDSILELQSEAAPFQGGAVRVRFREMEPFQARACGQRHVAWAGCGTGHLEPPAPQDEGTLHQLKLKLKPVNKHKTNGVTL